MNIRSWSLARKMALLGVVGALLFAVPFGFYLRGALEVIAGSRAEQAGIAPAKALVRVVQLTQQHRGLFTSGMDQARSAKQAEADRDYAAFGALLAQQGGDAALAADWKKIDGDWAAVTQAIAGGALPRPEGFARQTELITRELDLLQRLIERSGLAFDAEPEVHHVVQATLVHLPALTESLGRARARGAAYLAAGKLDPAEQTTVSVFAQTARMQQASAATALDKAFALDGALRGALAPAQQAGVAEADKTFALIDAEVLRPSAPSLAAPDYFKTLTTAIDAQVLLLDRAMAQLEGLLKARAARQRVELSAALGVLGLLLLATLGFGHALARSITRPLREAVVVAQAVAEGDLGVHVPTGGRDEIGQLLAALALMTRSLRTLVGEVAGGAHMVADTSAQIAQGNLDLSQRTEEQASTLEETASSMEELTSTVTQNADTAREASRLAIGASDVARKGGQVVGEVVSTMNGISESSRRIAEIIGVIDGIAFQTNILALNAAVEAARAGEQGRGFAVVASEVRNLAQRSASAAKEIKTLIGASVDKVEAGAKLVGSAGATMEEIVASVRKVSDLIAEIAAASQEQSAGIEQVNTAVTQMDQVVQQNASLVEEATAATESMKEQAAGLLASVRRFKLGAGDGVVPVPVAAVQPIVVRPALARVPAPAASSAAQRLHAPRGEQEWAEF